MNEIYPRLLDENLKEIGRVHPSRLQVSVKLTPPSSATMSVPEGESEIRMRGFVELRSPAGSLGIYRVSSVSPEYGEARTVGMKHGISVLSDAITGADETIEGSARAVISKLLEYQTQKMNGKPMWRLGKVDVPDNVKVVVDGKRANVFQTLLEVMRRPGINGKYRLQFDQDAMPWTMNVVAMSGKVECEGRRGRNLTGVMPMYSDSDLCTRVHHEDLPGGYMEVESPYGVVSRTITIPEGVNAEEYAREYLEQHREPKAEIKLDALDLHEITGDEYDQFAIGKMCCVPLGEYGTVLRYRVMSVTYDDIVSDPESIEVVLSNNVEDASYYLASQNGKLENNSNSIRSNRDRISQQGIELKKTYSDLVELNGSVAGQFNEVSIKLDEVNATIDLNASQTIASLDGLTQRLTSAEIKIDGANANILLKADASTVNALGERVSAAEIEIDGLNSEITLKADKVTIDAELTSIKKYFAGSATVAKMIVTNLTAMSMTFDGMKCAWANVEIPTAVRIPALSGYNVTLGDGSKTVIYAFSGNSRACTLTKDSMSLMKATT